MQGLAIASPRVSLAVDLAVKLATVALLVWAVLSPELPQFQGKAFTGRAIAYPIALLAVPIGWWLFARRRFQFPVAADILFGLPFLIDVGGNALNLYDKIEWWDDLNHLVNWVLHTSAVGLLLRYGNWTAATRVALAFGYAVTSAVLWELAEYVTFVPNSPEAASAYADTLLDLALGMLGGLVGAVMTSRLPLQARKPGGTIAGWLEITVDGERWSPATSLEDCGPDDSCYVVRIEDDGSARVIFGDGKTGRRLPSGSRIEAIDAGGTGARSGTASTESLGETLVDLMAQLGDAIARHQEEVADEAYLETADQRISLGDVTEIRRALTEADGKVCICLHLDSGKPHPPVTSN